MGAQSLIPVFELFFFSQLLVGAAGVVSVGAAFTAVSCAEQLSR